MFISTPFRWFISCTSCTYGYTTASLDHFDQLHWLYLGHRPISLACSPGSAYDWSRAYSLSYPLMYVSCSDWLSGLSGFGGERLLGCRLFHPRLWLGHSELGYLARSIVVMLLPRSTSDSLSVHVMCPMWVVCCIWDVMLSNLVYVNYNEYGSYNICEWNGTLSTYGLLWV